MKTNHLIICAGLVAALTLSSCASLFTKSSQKITFKGLPGTTVIDKKKDQSIAEIGSNGFATVDMRKGLKSKNLLVIKDGYKSQEFKLGTKIQPWFWGNLILGGIIGGGIDAATGKMKKYNTDFMDVTLKNKIERPETVEVVEIVTPMKNVTPTGNTEPNILRWYFDSDPRGARISWRVISNCPEEVKNTNESYLTTTPLEETRAFNIPGLTYENSANVTVEFKVSKRGYEDQVKRYNVRQALDQQEISGFFELVPKN